MPPPAELLNLRLVGPKFQLPVCRTDAQALQVEGLPGRSARGGMCAPLLYGARGVAREMPCSDAMSFASARPMQPAASREPDETGNAGRQVRDDAGMS
jgi:hypothetical protein